MLIGASTGLNGWVAIKSLSHVEPVCYEDSHSSLNCITIGNLLRVYNLADVMSFLEGHKKTS